MSYSGHFSSASNCGISLNSSQLATSIEAITAADRMGVTTTSAANFGGSLCVRVTMRAGDKLRPHSSGTGAGTAASNHVIVSATAKSEHVVTAAESTPNVFSAYITNSGTPTVSTQSSDFISSITDNSAGNSTINFISGFFTVAPTVFVSSTLAHTEVSNISTSGVTIVTANSGFSATDAPFSLSVERQGTDVKNASFLIAIPVAESCYLKDVKSAGAAGGTFTQDAWRTRDLTVANKDGGTSNDGCSWCVLSSNRFTVPAGTYDLYATLPARIVNSTKCRLYDITNSVDAIIGATMGNGGSLETNSVIDGTITPTVPTTYEIQHYCTLTSATNGFGYPSNIDSKSEVYTQVRITKIK